MIIGIGLDLVEIERIQKSWSRFGLKFAEHILCPSELEKLPSHPAVYLASRFAAKEAAMKAVGTGYAQGVTFHSFEISSLPSGKPLLSLRNKAEIIAREQGVERIHLSITHGRETAAAVVIFEN